MEKDDGKEEMGERDGDGMGWEWGRDGGGKRLGIGKEVGWG